MCYVVLQKLADQERKFQAELETWKMAEFNRSNFEKQTQNTNVQMYNSYQPGKQTRQIPEYSHNVSMQNTSNNQLNQYSNATNCHPSQVPVQSLYNNQPLITRNRNVSRILPNTARPSTSLINRNVQRKEFLSANEFYLQNQDKRNESEENEGEEFSNRPFDNSNETVPNQTSKVTAPKRRKLLNSNDNFL